MLQYIRGDTVIKYYKLFDLLNRKGMKKTDLLEIISSPTLAKLSKGENVKVDVIEKICIFLNCQPGDIMEYEKTID
ncbi:helix-turn-helix domain-containing protein [Clostridium cellulovorans]|uniref:helix-turn-helix domain-containing protein n=1 Tax=Clostridium cellulovorans TaxID=1493 RepID=UPI00059FB0C7|nr:helix-turn-helix domain-containing protein [Clostridium cellulovorans]